MFAFTKAGKDWNEDACYVCKNFAFVLDGETTLVKKNFSNEQSDAKWCSNWWANYLKKHLKNKSKTIPEILKIGTQEYTNAFQNLANGETIQDFPSTMGSIVRNIDGMIEFYVLGNCPIIFKTKTNHVFLVCDPLNNIVDDINLAIYKDIANKENISVLDARTKYPEYLLDARLNKNSFGGYFNLCNKVDSIEHGIYNKISTEIIDKILILSDGYTQVFDLMKFITPEELINNINCKKDAEKIYNKLFIMQEEDKNCNQFVRFKIRDDATLVCMEIKK